MEVTAIFGGFRAFLSGFGHLGQHAAGAVDTSQRFPVDGRFTDSFGQYVAGALQRLLHRTDFPFHILAGFLFRTGGLAFPEQIGQRLQSPGYRHRSTGFPFGPIRQIQILQLTGIHTVFYLLPKGRRQLFLFFDGLQDRRLALFHLGENFGPVLDFGHFDVIEAARTLLPVTADERDGAAIGKQFRAILHLPGLHAQQLSNILDVEFFHS